MPRALRSYNKFAHVRDYVRVNRMEVPEWNNRMEMVEMVDCNGWPFWASVTFTCPSTSSRIEKVLEDRCGRYLHELCLVFSLCQRIYLFIHCVGLHQR